MFTIKKMIPGNIKEILINLEYLSKIEQGKKPCMSDQTFVNAYGFSSYYGAFVRFMKSEGRKNMMIQINSIVDQALDALVKYKDADYYALLVEKLLSAKEGLQNLTRTYVKYPRITSDITVCIDNINLQLNKHCRQLVAELKRNRENLELPPMNNYQYNININPEENNND